MEDKKKYLIEMLNKAIECCEPIAYEQLNVFIKAKDDAKLIDFEQSNEMLGLAFGPNREFGVSVVALMASISDVLCGERIAVIIDDDTGYVTGFCWSGYHAGGKVGEAS